MSEQLKADIVVLGSGPGGYSAAFRAADLGKRVILIERYENIGGVCLNVGCIPSKALLHVAKVIDDAKDVSSLGVAFSAPKLDIDKIRAGKDNVIKKLTGGLKMMAKQRKVYYRSRLWADFSMPTRSRLNRTVKKPRSVLISVLLRLGRYRLICRLFPTIPALWTQPVPYS